MTAGNHHLPKAVHLLQAFLIYFEKSVAGRLQLYLAFFDLGFLHILVFAHLAEDHSSIIFMQHAFISLPDIKMILAYGKQYRNILLAYHMSLAENSILGDAPDNLGQVVAEDAAHRVNGFN